MDANLEKSNELQKIAQPMSVNDLARMSNAFAQSGMFPDIKSAAMAMVKIQAGLEVGIKPFAAMTGIHIIQGRPTIGAGIIASRIKASPKYDYKVVEMTDKNCSIDFYQGKEMIGNSSFSIEDARKAQTKNLDKFPKNMLFARAISNGVKWYTPDVFDGPVYVPEEMEQVTEDVQYKEVKQQHDTTTKAVKAEPIIQQSEPVPGHWHAKLEKCKTKEEIDALAIENKEDVQANPELRKVFGQYYNSLKKQSANQ